MYFIFRCGRDGRWNCSAITGLNVYIIQKGRKKTSIMHQIKKILENYKNTSYGANVDTFFKFIFKKALKSVAFLLIHTIASLKHQS